MSNEKVRSKGYVVYLVVFMGLVALVDQYLSLVETSVVTSIADHYFGGDETQFFFWAGIFGFAAFLVTFLTMFADLWGRRIGIAILLLLMSVCAIGIGFVGHLNFWAFMSLYAIVIMATNANLWTIPVSEESPPKRRAFNGSMAFLIGLIPLYAFIAEPITNAFGWQWAYGVFGIVGLLVFIMWFWMKETNRWKEKKTEIKESVKIKKRISKFKELTKRDWVYVLITGAIYLCWNLAFKAATLTVEPFFLGNPSYTTFYYLAGVSTILGALVIGFLMEKVGRIFSFIFASVGAAVGYFLMAFLGHLIGMVLVYFFMAAFLGFILVYISEIFPTKTRATGVGLAITLSRIGYVVAPLIASAIAPRYDILYIITGVIALLPLLSLIFNRYESKGKKLEEIEQETATFN